MIDKWYSALLLPVVAVVLLIFTAKMTLEAIREARQ